MVKLSNRQINILEVLLKHEDYIPTSLLAESLNVSVRTIYRELEGVSSFLKAFNLKLISKSRLGYQLLGKQDEKDKLCQFLDYNHREYGWKNAEERRSLVLIEILKSNGYKKLQTLASKLNVSEGTVSRDIDHIKTSVAHLGIDITTRKGHGIEVLGDEENIRKAISDIVYNNLEMTLALGFDIKSNLLLYFENQNSGILGLLNRDDLETVIDVLANASNEIIYRITEFSLIGLVIHLTVAVNRIRNGEEIILDKKMFKDMKDEPMYADAIIIAGDIENKFGIRFPKDEIGYILMHLKGTRPRVVDKESERDIDIGNYEAMLLVERLVNRFSEIMNHNFHDDEMLITGLLAHLAPSIIRLNNNLMIRNPLLNEIKKEYSELFIIVKEISKIINEKLNVDVSDDEIAYLTLHFGAAIERMKLAESDSILNLGVVCASGIGISALLSSTIRSNFPDTNRVEPLSVEEVLNEDLASLGFDLLVSTLDITSDIPIVFVNPLLGDADLSLIRSAMDKIRFTNNSKGSRYLTINPEIIGNIRLVGVDFSQYRDEFIKTLIDEITDDPQLSEDIFKRIIEREKVAPVILKDHKFVLYHSSIENLDKPYVIFFYAQDEKRTLLYENIDIGAMMLLPKPTNAQDRYTLSNISKAIIEEKNLMTSIQNKNLEGIKEILKESMRNANG